MLACLAADEIADAKPACVEFAQRRWQKLALARCKHGSDGETPRASCRRRHAGTAHKRTCVAETAHLNSLHVHGSKGTDVGEDFRLVGPPLLLQDANKHRLPWQRAQATGYRQIHSHPAGGSRAERTRQSRWILLRASALTESGPGHGGGPGSASV